MRTYLTFPWKSKIVTLFLANLMVVLTYGQQVFDVDNNNNSGPGSLRQAIISANAVPLGTDVYIYLTNLQTVKSPNQAVINLTTKELSISRPMTIEAGFSANYPKVKITNTARDSRLLTLENSVNGQVKLINLVFDSGKAIGSTEPANNGGAIYYRKNSLSVLQLVLDSCEFTNNQAGPNAEDANGEAPMGGAIYFYNVSVSEPAPSLEIKNCVFAHNSIKMIQGYGGSAVFSRQVKITIRDTKFSYNTVASPTGFAGAVYIATIAEEKTILEKCSFLHNQSASENSALVIVGTQGSAGPPGYLAEMDSCLFAYNQGAQATVGIRGNGVDPFLALVKNTTFYANEANMNNSALRKSANADVTLLHCTITRNLCNNSLGSAVSSIINTGYDPGALRFQHCVIAGNGYKTGVTGNLQSPDVAPSNLATMTSLGYNRIGSGMGVETIFQLSTDLYGINNTTVFDPMLATLANYGGPTLTAPPMPDSPLIDRIPPASASLVPLDARLLSRPQGASADIGAVELPRISYLDWDDNIPLLANRDANLDPDGDGIKNKLEYFLGTNPNTFTKNPLYFVETAEGRYLELLRWSKPRPLFFTNTQISLSSNLDTWEKLEVKPEVSPATEGSLDFFRYRYPLDGLMGESKKFFRIEVE